MAATKLTDRQAVQSIDLTSEVANALPVANGGTGATSLSANAALLGNGTSAVQTAAPGNAGNVLRSDGTTWSSSARILTGTTASSATPSINCDNTDQYNITALAVAITSVTITGTPVDGQRLMVRIKDNGTARAIAWGASFVSSGASTLLATTVAGKTHHVGLRYDSTAAKWVCLAVDSAGY